MDKEEKNQIFKLLELNNNKYLVVSFLSAIFVAAINIVYVYMIMKLVDNFNNMTKHNFWDYVLIIIGISVVGVIAKFIMTYISQKICSNTIFEVRRKIMQKLSQSNIDKFDNEHSGAIISKINNNVSQMEKFLNNNLVNYIYIPVTILLAMSLLIYINWKLLIISFFCTPLASILIKFVTRDMGKFAGDYYGKREKENKMITEVISGISIVKSFNLEEDIIENYRSKSYESMKSGLRLDRRSISVLPLVIIMNELPYIICAIAGGIMASRKLISAGELIAFIQLLRILIGPSTQVMNMISDYQNAKGAAKGIFELLNIEQENFEGIEVKGKLNKENIIEFDSVSFSYNKEDKVLDDVTFKLNLGEKVAFIGQSGSGKSTIIKLICRLYQQDSGEIYFNGKKINELKINDVREKISVVSQNIHIFNGTISDNIRCGKHNISMDEVMKAAQFADIDQYIKGLEKGYETILMEDGNNLSGGQRQKIAIARAFLKKSDIIIMDEPTSSLDFVSEKCIEKAISTLAKNRLFIIVAHRMSFVKNADRMYVVQKGKIVDEGLIDDMLARESYFNQQYRTQCDLG